MYDEEVLKGLAARLIEKQDDPADLLADLHAVRDQHDEQGIPEDIQRFELRLELDRDDMDAIIAEVEAEVEDDDQ